MEPRAPCKEAGSMKKTLCMLLAASAVVLAQPASADEYDFVGYDYSQDTKRDYDRGFFAEAEAWYVNVRDLHYEPVLSSAGAPIGGRLLDVDWDFDVSGRFGIGYKANRRIGTFALRYWDFSDDVLRSETGGIYGATGTTPGRGDVVRDSFNAFADVDIEVA